MSKVRYRRVTVLLPEELWKVACKMKGQTSDLIRRALAQYLNLPEVAVKRGRPRELHE